MSLELVSQVVYRNNTGMLDTETLTRRFKIQPTTKDNSPENVYKLSSINDLKFKQEASNKAEGRSAHSSVSISDIAPTRTVLNRIIFSSTATLESRTTFLGVLHNAMNNLANPFFRSFGAQHGTNARLLAPNRDLTSAPFLRIA